MPEKTIRVTVSLDVYDAFIAVLRDAREELQQAKMHLEIKDEEIQRLRTELGKA